MGAFSTLRREKFLRDVEIGPVLPIADLPEVDAIMVELVQGSVGDRRHRLGGAPGPGRRSDPGDAARCRLRAGLRGGRSAGSAAAAGFALGGCGAPNTARSASQGRADELTLPSTLRPDASQPFHSVDPLHGPTPRARCVVPAPVGRAPDTAEHALQAATRTAHQCVSGGEVPDEALRRVAHESEHSGRVLLPIHGHPGSRWCRR